VLVLCSSPKRERSARGSHQPVASDRGLSWDHVRSSRTRGTTTLTEELQYWSAGPRVTGRPCCTSTRSGLPECGEVPRELLGDGRRRSGAEGTSRPISHAKDSSVGSRAWRKSSAVGAKRTGEPPMIAAGAFDGVECPHGLDAWDGQPDREGDLFGPETAIVRGNRLRGRSQRRVRRALLRTRRAGLPHEAWAEYEAGRNVSNPQAASRPSLLADV
jgi:hypothetical protein